jgi:hypothetical protein
MFSPVLAQGVNASAPMFKGQSEPTEADINALSSDFAGLLLGNTGKNNGSSLYDLYGSPFKINGVGITAVNGKPALSVFTASAEGRNALIQALLHRPGSQKMANPAVFGGLRSGDAVISIQYSGKAIPVFVQLLGKIVPR